MRALHLAVALLFLAALASPGLVRAPAAAARGPAARAPTSRVLRLGPGRQVRRFTLREPSGVILLARITVPRGTHAFVDANVPHVGGTRFRTAGRVPLRSLACRRRGADEVCTQQQEWCPFPAAHWRMRLVQSSGPGGRVRVDFVVGPPPPALKR
ncbi:MAG: hypothetical protein ACRDLK_08040 [Gaiellaceae bacterium]